LSAFFVELGVPMMVASAMVPAPTFSPRPLPYLADLAEQLLAELVVLQQPAELQQP